MQRSDGPAIRDTLIWFAALIVTGGLGGYLSGAPGGRCRVFVVYGVLYGSASDSRWHECGHGTAFKTRWMNDVVYQIACFMILREPTVWRWSHTRHHTDTIIVGRDPEIAVPRPPDSLEIAAQPLRAEERRCARSASCSCTRRGRLTRGGGDLHPRDGALEGLSATARI